MSGEEFDPEFSRAIAERTRGKRTIPYAGVEKKSRAPPTPPKIARPPKKVGMFFIF